MRRSEIAEIAATAAIQSYCAAMRPSNTEELACFLTKLISTASQAVVKYSGTAVAIDVLERTRDHIAKSAA